MRNFIKLVLSLAICQVAGLLGSVFTSKSISTWYLSINKPSFNPPNWIFAPVWISLYFLMGIALFLVWKKESIQKIGAISLFFIQLVLNSFWSVAFFGLKSPLLGFIVILILWVFILLTIIKFFKLSNLAGWLLIPYILWVSFATVLNFAILILN